MTVGTASLRQAATLPAAAYAAPRRPNDNVLLADQRLRRHKALPHPAPRKNGSVFLGPAIGEEPTLHQHPSARVAQHPALGRIVAKLSLPDPPPTPPAYSRSSSGTHSARPSSPTYVEPVSNNRGRGDGGDDQDEQDGDEEEDEEDQDEDEQDQEYQEDQDSDHNDHDAQRPETPSHQKSPPTPDVTPPLPSGRPSAVRPDAGGTRVESKGTAESRSESFRTAPEDPWSSVEDNVGSRATTLGMQPKGPSTKTSQSTIRPDGEGEAGRGRRRDTNKTPQPPPAGLGLDLQTLARDMAPSKPFFSRDHRNDGHRGSEHEVEQEWDDNLQRNVVVRKRRPRAQKEQVVETRLVSPTNATKALRGLNLQDRTRDPLAAPRKAATPNPPEPSVNTDFRRFSGVSTRSTASTVVEAILVDAPPRRQRTLRHVRKNAALRDSGSEVSSSVVSSTATDRSGGRAPMPMPMRPLPANRPDDSRSQSIVSNNSISSRSARRDIWKNGGIPVVVVPARSSSRHSDDDTPSLRSSSKRRRRQVDSTSSSKRPESFVATSATVPPSVPPLSGDRQGRRRSRRMSDSDRSECTIDFPPSIPQRSSSLSAPTSRNASRPGSMKEDSQIARHALQIHITKAFEGHSPQGCRSPQPPESPILPSPSRRPLSADSEVARNRLSLDAKRLSVHNTPFSVASLDTNMTGVTNVTSNAEVSEATIVTLHPHQNSSVLIVDHRHESDELTEPRNAPPNARSTGPAEPATPPRRSSFADVDSPLRNPRAPPEPPTKPPAPALALTLATPSGYTPASEKRELMGNYFEVTGQKAPGTTAGSVVRRALSLTRKSESNPAPPLSSGRPAGLLRTWSLTRHLGRSQKPSRPDRIVYPTDDRPPPEEDKLHPYYEPPCHGCDDPECDGGRPRAVQQVRFRLPPKPTLGDRVRKTLALLPRTEHGTHGTDTPTASRPPIRNAQRRTAGSVSEPPVRRLADVDVDVDVEGEDDVEDEDEDEDEPLAEGGGPDRREIRRTPSGSLRVMRRRPSIESPMRAQFRPYEEAMPPRRRPDTWRRRNSLTGEAYQESNTSVGNSSAAAASGSGAVSRPPLSGNGIFPIEQIQGLSHRLRERRRERRSQELRCKISRPQEFRDPVQEVLRPRNSAPRPPAPAEIPEPPRPQERERETERQPDCRSDRGRPREWQRGYPGQSQRERSRDRERRRYEYDAKSREDRTDGLVVGRAL